jgi:hypothetical protein
MSSDPPIFACTLPPPEFRQRKAEVLASVRGKAQSVEETPAGFTFVFARSAGLEEELAEFVRFEAACCSFIRMEVVPRGDTTLVLNMTGVPEARPFIRAEFVEAGTPPTTPVAAPGCACTSGGDSCATL